MITKVYGVRGKMECSLLIQVGNTKRRIDFTGGCHTAFGVREATYSTNNPVMQFCIENSNHFQRGEIKLLRQYGKIDEPMQKSSQKDATSTTSTTSSKTYMVNDIDEARQYLIENCGVDGMTLIGEKAINQAMKQHGVTLKKG